MGLFDKLFGSPNQDKFAEMVAKAIQAAGEPGRIAYDKENFRLATVDEDGNLTSELHLGNVYQEYCGKPKAEQAAFMKTIVSTGLTHHKEMPEEYEDCKPDILPLVRCRSTYELLWLQQRVEGKEVGPEIPHYTIGDHLLASIAYDLPHTIQSFGVDQLDDWNVSLYEIMEVAKHNLQELDFAFAGLGESVSASMTGDNYDASRLLMLDLIRKLEVKGEHVAMVPHRDSLLITGSDDVDGLALMAKFADDAFEHPRFMSCTPLRLDGDEWVAWMPSAGHPHFDKFRFLEIKSVHQDYEQQKKLLERWHEIQLIDEFVSSYSVAEKDSGEVYSYSVWSDGLVSLLPKTNYVAFFREGDGVLASGDWDKVQRIVGHLMEETDMYPIRYRVKEFPTDEQLAAIGSEMG